ncbi:hypothetical protein LCGC14_0095470 [marine sediment metagenome]|uniref:Beta-galactosidase n=1 Tax=marine sediment metagenome TaxID=412755 RepID=A0A0F9VHT2_9ZZZZ|nr:beta-galactosidase [Phycisphaerae bacterium]HDZ45122.1 beta-galactosidase [Phycisphaerae bacterium]
MTPNINIPRGEHPRPQFVRDSWLNLNGQWQFEIDSGDSGLERGLKDRDLSGEITVPFCPESELSGVGHVDFMNAVWYRRAVNVPPDWDGQRVFLHFGAADFDTTCWVNGQEVGRHRGGWVSFTFEITHAVAAGGSATIVVRCRDKTRGNQPRGKQCPDFASYGCFYTRTTGIWQTVWLEATPQTHIRRPHIVPDLANKRFRLSVPLSSNPTGSKLRATASFDGKQVASAEVAADLDLSPMLDLVIPDRDVHLWGPGAGNLYDITLQLLDADGAVVDKADTYAGLRSIAIDGKSVKINGRSVFQRLVLDQGYYPDGVMTAPTDAALRADLELAMAVGFNGARFHEKVFEERSLYHADQLGFLIWSEYGDCGLEMTEPPMMMTTEWQDAIQRDRNHPCIVGWAGLCETVLPMEDNPDQLDDLMHSMVLSARNADPTRLALDSSGGCHRVRDIDVYDYHDYNQDPAKIAEMLKTVSDGNPPTDWRGYDKETCTPYRNQPFFLSEFGGTGWNPAKAESDEAWGYGDRPKNVEEFYERFKGLCDAVMDNPDIFGYVWTQIVDVHQEQNGIYFFDRTPKFDAARLKQIQSRKAAIEED